MTEVRNGLPIEFCKVTCFHKNSPNCRQGVQYYWFDPKDKTFRTPKGRNKTHRILRWEKA